MFDRFKRIGKGIAKAAIMATPQAQALKAIHKRLQDPTDDFGVVGDKDLLEVIAAQKARIEEQEKKMAADSEEALAVFEATKARAVAMCEKMARSGKVHGASKEFQAGAYACADIVRDMTEEEP
jgi:hypothetical protein